MGTLFRLVFYAPDQEAAQKAAKAAFARVEELNRIMSDYLPDSELMLLCKKAGGDPVQVSPDLFKVLEKSQEVARLSEGAFDVSVGPIVRLWRKARRTGKLPDPSELKKALALVDFQKIKLDPNGRRVQLLLMGMLLDLGGIAKGYTADAVLEVLRQHGIRQALVAAGGDITAGEAPPDARGWKIGIAALKKPGELDDQFILLTNAAVSTAGDLHQYVEIDGQRYSHIVNPKTGLGLVGRGSVTVIAPNGLTADALDTTACVLGPEKGLKLIESQDRVAALLIFETSEGVKTIPSRLWEKFQW